MKSGIPEEIKHPLAFLFNGCPTYFSNVSSIATSIFKNFDLRLSTKTYFLALPEKEGLPPIFTNSSNAVYSSDLFKDIFQKAKTYVFSEQDLKQWQGFDIENIQKKMSVKRKIEEILNNDSSNRNVISFCSYPYILNEHWFFIILQFSKEIYNFYKTTYSLKNENFEGNSNIAVSLIDACIEEFFYECRDELHISRTPIEHIVKQVINYAGISLLYIVTLRVGAAISKPLFYAIDELSLLTYEKSEAGGMILLAKREHQNISVDLTFNPPILIYNIKKIRKLLEMAKYKCILLSDGYYVYGFGKQQIDNYRDDLEKYYFIRFVKRHYWELLHNNRVLMRVINGQPQLPKEDYETELFKSKLSKIFKDITSEQTQNLIDLFIYIYKLSHGTTVVISANPQSELLRLEKQCTGINPVKLTRDLMSNVTRIDGAVLIDLDTKCHAIGVILDGKASPNCDSSRGSRYNSAINYVESDKIPPCLVIIKSEDGNMDLKP